MAARGRRSAGGSTGPRWIALGIAGVVILGGTFGLGVLAGRQWARHAPVVAAAGAAQKTTAPRRGGLTEAQVERAPQIQEKLTFYQTLTAPLGPGPLSEKTEAPKPSPARARPIPDRPSAHDPEVGLPRRASSDAAEKTAPPARPVAAVGPRHDADPNSAVTGPGGAQPGANESRGASGSEWTVQVGVFSSAQQAAGVKKQLAAKGFDAQVTAVPSSDGQARYRVRVGTFKTRDEAIRVADRVRAGSVPTYVTAAK